MGQFGQYGRRFARMLAGDLGLRRRERTSSLLTTWIPGEGGLASRKSTATSAASRFLTVMVIASTTTGCERSTPLRTPIEGVATDQGTDFGHEKPMPPQPIQHDDAAGGHLPPPQRRTFWRTTGRLSRGFCLVVGGERRQPGVRNRYAEVRLEGLRCIEPDAEKSRDAARDKLFAQAETLRPSRRPSSQCPNSIAIPFSNYFANLVVSDTLLSRPESELPVDLSRHRATRETAWRQDLPPLRR